ncbi:MAG: hypothetical protein SF052_27855 [Bacteroidia bacterium]|nr:hypothetical protein [Bacteroidia bacterium]
MRRIGVYVLVGWMLLGVLPVEAQTSVTARLDLTRREPKPEFYEYSPADGGLVTLGPSTLVSNRFLSLTKYDNNLQKQWTKQVLEQNGRKNIDFVAVIGANILVFVSEFFQKEGVIKTYYYGFDLEGNEIAKEETLSVYPNQKEQKVELQYVFSPNKRRLLCYKNLKNKRDSEEILYYIFDDEGDFMQDGQLELKYPDNRFQVVSLRVSNGGNIFVLGKFFRTVTLKEATDFQYVVYRYDVSVEKGREIPIELGDRYITNLAFRLDRDENIYVAGFYSNRASDQIAGTILQQIRPDGTIALNANEAFDEGFLRNYLSNTQIQRGRELRNFYLDSEDGIILRSDGGVLLIAEKFYITYQSYRDLYGYWVDREIYHYEDVILTSINGAGNIEWHAIVDKNQESESPTALSYFNAVSSQGSYIFYEYKPRKRDINIYYNTIGMSGRVSERIPLLNDYKFGDQFFPRFCEQINNDEALMVYMQNRGKTLSVVKVQFTN